MNKLVSVLLCLILMSGVPVAVAEIDLSGMTFDELLGLKEQINIAIWNSDGWQEVIVPNGIYEIGVDIPEGHWSVEAIEGSQVTVFLSSEPIESTLHIDYSDCVDVKVITSRSNKYYKENQSNYQIDLVMHPGQFFAFDKDSVIFKPYTGKNLGFK